MQTLADAMVGVGDIVWLDGTRAGCSASNYVQQLVGRDWSEHGPTFNSRAKAAPCSTP